MLEHTPSPAKFTRLSSGATGSCYSFRLAVVHLGSTNECATSNKFVPMFEGRSSIGRLGISTHITAGFGDVGFGYVDGKCVYPTWTLEISVVQPVRVYPNIRIGQVYFIKMMTEPTKLYTGKYSLQKEAQPSMLYKDREFEDNVQR